jgi:hypothetical protein
MRGRLIDITIKVLVLCSGAYLGTTCVWNPKAVKASGTYSCCGTPDCQTLNLNYFCEQNSNCAPHGTSNACCVEACNS